PPTGDERAGRLGGGAGAGVVARALPGAPAELRAPAARQCRRLLRDTGGPGRGAHLPRPGAALLRLRLRPLAGAAPGRDRAAERPQGRDYSGGRRRRLTLLRRRFCSSRRSTPALLGLVGRLRRGTRSASRSSSTSRSVASSRLRHWLRSSWAIARRSGPAFAI